MATLNHLQMPRWLMWSLLLTILAIAAVARAVNIDKNCYFFDEAWIDELSTGRGSLHGRLELDVIHEQVPKVTSLAAAPSWVRIWTHMDHVTHPPFGMILLRWWRDVLGESPAASRSLSAVFSIIAI